MRRFDNNCGVSLEESIKLAAEKFDLWMKNFKDSHRESGDFDDNNKALVCFLNGDRGFEFIKTYEALCQLAVLLQEKGYKTTNPPCEPTEFDRAVEEANPRSFGGSRPVISEPMKLRAAVRKQETDDYISRRVEKS